MPGRDFRKTLGIAIQKAVDNYQRTESAEAPDPDNEQFIWGNKIGIIDGLEKAYALFQLWESECIEHIVTGDKKCSKK